MRNSAALTAATPAPEPEPLPGIVSTDFTPLCEKKLFNYATVAPMSRAAYEAARTFMEDFFLYGPPEVLYRYDSIADDVVSAWGGLDVWISNAGISPIVAGPLQTDASTWRRVLDVNLTGAFLGARAAARVMGDGGRLIFTGSVLGERPREGLTAYSASKAGLVGLAKGLALDLAPAGITVNVVAPGWFDSPLADGWMNDPELSARITGHTAQGRWGAPADLAGAYLFLASDASAFVTGTVLNVDGGYLLV